jgi:truncated hemoglobin YjbI
MSPFTGPIPPSIAVVVRKEDLATTTTTSNHIVLDQLTAEFGQGFCDEVLEDFFFRLLDDNDLLRFFEGVNNKFLQQHQRKFLMYIFTDQIPSHAHELISRGHKRLFDKGLSERHFDKVTELLAETLLCRGVKPSLIRVIKENAAPIRAIFQENAKRVKAKIPLRI